jgi:type II secretory pathway component GspD/PulD (secretin)
VRQSATGIEVNSQLEQSSVSEEKSTVGSSDPVIRQTTLHSTALLTVGKPIMLGSLDLPGSTRHLDIEVVLEVLR